MPERIFEIRILRWKPGAIEPARFESFRVGAEEGTTVLDALERIRRELDPGLMYRHSCHHASCGTCACRVNGAERLACTTRLRDLGAEAVTLEPLRGFPVVADLVVDVRGFFADIDPAWDCLRPAAPPAAGEGGLRRFEDCIECGACVSVCPVDREQPGFMGPAALAAVNAQRLKHPADEPALLALAGTERGQARCERALRCSQVCPAGVFPARHIMELRKRLTETF